MSESFSPEGPEEALITTSFAPPVDIHEDQHNITLKMEVSGIEEKDIDVRIEGNTLTVHGQRKLEKEEKEENYRRIERQYTSPDVTECVQWPRRGICGLRKVPRAETRS